MEPDITIFYYDAKGRVEFCRLLMAAKGICWKDVIIKEEQWSSWKEKTPFGQLPCIEVDGCIYAQSLAMAYYVAKLAGFYGKNNLDDLKADQVVQLAADCLNTAVQAFYEKDEAIKAEKLKHFSEVGILHFFNHFEKLLKQCGTGYFVGNSLSIADFCVYDLVFTPSKWKTFKTDGFPFLQGLKNIVESNENIKAYLATRKVTEY